MCLFYQISQLLKVAKYILKLAKLVAFGIKYCKGSLKRANFSNKIATLPPNVTRGATRFRESVLSNDSFHNSASESIRLHPRPASQCAYYPPYLP